MSDSNFQFLLLILVIFSSVLYTVLRSKNLKMKLKSKIISEYDLLIAKDIIVKHMKSLILMSLGLLILDILYFYKSINIFEDYIYTFPFIIYVLYFLFTIKYVKLKIDSIFHHENNGRL